MTIHIGVFRHDVTDADLIAFFAENDAEVTEVQVLTDEFSGRSRHIGRAQAENPSEVVRKCDGKLLKGFPVGVREIA